MCRRACLPATSQKCSPAQLLGGYALQPRMQVFTMPLILCRKILCHIACNCSGRAVICPAAKKRQSQRGALHQPSSLAMAVQPSITTNLHVVYKPACQLPRMALCLVHRQKGLLPCPLLVQFMAVRGGWCCMRHARCNVSSIASPGPDPRQGSSGQSLTP